MTLPTTPVTTAPQTAATPGTALPLRRDEVVSTSFVLETILVMVLMLGALTLLLRWLNKKKPGQWARKTERRIVVLEATRLSARTRLTLVEIDGAKAVVTETPQGASLQLLPNHAPLSSSTLAVTNDTVEKLS